MAAGDTPNRALRYVDRVRMRSSTLAMTLVAATAAPAVADDGAAPLIALERTRHFVVGFGGLVGTSHAGSSEALAIGLGIEGSVCVDRFAILAEYNSLWLSSFEREPAPVSSAMTTRSPGSWDGTAQRVGAVVRYSLLRGLLVEPARDRLVRGDLFIELGAGEEWIRGSQAVLRGDLELGIGVRVSARGGPSAPARQHGVGGFAIALRALLARSPSDARVIDHDVVLAATFFVGG